MLRDMCQVFWTGGRTVPKQRGTKSEAATSPLPSRGPKRGRKCCVSPAFLGVPKQRGTKSELARRWAHRQRHAF